MTGDNSIWNSRERGDGLVGIGTRKVFEIALKRQFPLPLTEVYDFSEVFCFFVLFVSQVSHFIRPLLHTFASVAVRIGSDVGVFLPSPTTTSHLLMYRQMPSANGFGLLFIFAFKALRLAVTWAETKRCCNVTDML